MLNFDVFRTEKIRLSTVCHFRDSTQLTLQTSENACSYERGSQNILGESSVIQ